MDFHSPSVFQEKLQLALNITAVVTCLKSLLNNSLEFIILVTSMSIKNLPEIFLFRFVPLACFAESTYMYATQSAD